MCGYDLKAQTNIRYNVTNDSKELKSKEIITCISFIGHQKCHINTTNSKYKYSNNNFLKNHSFFVLWLSFDVDLKCLDPLIIIMTVETNKSKQ